MNAEREHARALLEMFERRAAEGLRSTCIVIRRKGPPAGEFARTALGKGEIANAVEESGGWRWAVYVENATAIRRLKLALAGEVRR